MITLSSLRVMANNDAVYDHLDSMPDSTAEVIEIQNRPENKVQVQGLYFINDDGVHETPRTLWFGCHFYRDDISHQNYGGNAYTMRNCALYPVYLPTGERMRMPNLRDVSCYYDGERLSDFHRE